MRVNLELEITLRCNASCPECSRHCNRFEYGLSDMTLEQIRRFISQVRESGTSLDLLSIMGGEPTLHPLLEAIVLELLKGLAAASLVRRMVLATNGMLPVPEWIGTAGVQVMSSPPEHKRHRCQLIAPADTGQETGSCDVPSRCGMALGYFGYAPCGAGGAIARLFGMHHLLRHELPRSRSDFGDLHELCSLCQRSAVQPLMLEDHDPGPSASFRRAIDRYHSSRPSYRPF